MHVGNYVGLTRGSEQRLVDALNTVAEHHGDEPDIFETCQLLASWSRKHIEHLKPLEQRYGEDKKRPSSTGRVKEAWHCCVTCMTSGC